MPLKILLTGGTTGISFHIARHFLSKEHQLYIMSRNTENLLAIHQANNQLFKGIFEFDFTKSDPEEIEPIFQQLPTLDAVVHCASPYARKSFLDSTLDELQNFSNAMLNDQSFTFHAIKSLKKNDDGGLLIFKGTVTGSPSCHSFGAWGLFKSHKRQLAMIVQHELQNQDPNVFVKYLNLGSIRDVVNDHRKELPTQTVIDGIEQMLENPNLSPIIVSFLSDQNLEDYGREYEDELFTELSPSAPEAGA